MNTLKENKPDFNRLSEVFTLLMNKGCEKFEYWIKCRDESENSDLKKQYAILVGLSYEVLIKTNKVMTLLIELMNNHSLLTDDCVKNILNMRKSQDDILNRINQLKQTCENKTLNNLLIGILQNSYKENEAFIQLNITMGQVPFALISAEIAIYKLFFQSILCAFEYKPIEWKKILQESLNLILGFIPVVGNATAIISYFRNMIDITDGDIQRQQLNDTLSDFNYKMESQQKILWLIFTTLENTENNFNKANE